MRVSIFLTLTLICLQSCEIPENIEEQVSTQIDSLQTQQDLDGDGEVDNNNQGEIPQQEDLTEDDTPAIQEIDPVREIICKVDWNLPSNRAAINADGVFSYDFVAPCKGTYYITVMSPIRAVAVLDSIEAKAGDRLQLVQPIRGDGGLMSDEAVRQSEGKRLSLGVRIILPRIANDPTEGPIYFARYSSTVLGVLSSLADLDTYESRPKVAANSAPIVNMTSFSDSDFETTFGSPRIISEDDNQDGANMIVLEGPSNATYEQLSFDLLALNNGMLPVKSRLELDFTIQELTENLAIFIDAPTIRRFDISPDLNNPDKLIGSHKFSCEIDQLENSLACFFDGQKVNLVGPFASTMRDGEVLTRLNLRISLGTFNRNISTPSRVEITNLSMKEIPSQPLVAIEEFRSSDFQSVFGSPSIVDAIPSDAKNVILLDRVSDNESYEQISFDFIEKLGGNIPNSIRFGIEFEIKELNEKVTFLLDSPRVRTYTIFPGTPQARLGKHTYECLGDKILNTLECFYDGNKIEHFGARTLFDGTDITRLDFRVSMGQINRVTSQNSHVEISRLAIGSYEDFSKINIKNFSSSDFNVNFGTPKIENYESNNSILLQNGGTRRTSAPYEQFRFDLLKLVGENFHERMKVTVELSINELNDSFVMLFDVPSVRRYDFPRTSLGLQKIECFLVNSENSLHCYNNEELLYKGTLRDSNIITRLDLRFSLGTLNRPVTDNSEILIHSLKVEKLE